MAKREGQWPSPVTAENFRLAWGYVDRQRRMARKRAALAAFPVFVSHIALLLLTIFAANGLILELMEGSYCDMLRRIPYFEEAWSFVSGLILNRKLHWSMQCATVLVAVLLLSVTAYLLAALPVALLYYPGSKEIPSLSPKEKSSLLVGMAREARRYASRTKMISSNVFAFAFGVLVLAMMGVYFLFMGDAGAAIAAFGRLPMLGQIGIPIMIIPILFFGLFFLYAGLDNLFGLMIRSAYRFTVPYALIADVEAYSVFADRYEDGLSDEEILARRRAFGEKRREEALELERQGATKNVRAMLLEAALVGDMPAMGHYARHCIIVRDNESAVYWLERCIQSGNQDRKVKRAIRRLKRKKHVEAQYLPVEAKS